MFANNNQNKQNKSTTKLTTDGARSSTRRSCAEKLVGSMNEKTLSQQAIRVALDAALKASKLGSGSK